MAISFDNALGIHQYTMGIRSERAEILSSNLANADTPGYKAKDVDFKQALADAKGSQSRRQNLARTNEKHFDVGSSLSPHVKYRVPLQPDTGDGNTVDVQVERNKFLQNGMEYQASVQFLGSKFKGLTKALKGE